MTAFRRNSAVRRTRSLFRIWPLFGPCRVSRHGLPHLAEVRPGEELGTKMLGFIRAEVSDPNEGKHLSDAA